MARALKVYRTAVGFHDAYVAAPSMKAALAAWGTDKDLFARQAAELVEDPTLTAEPLAHPGEVIRKLRGSAAEHVKALGKMPCPRAAKPASAQEAEASPLKPPPRPPKPSDEEVGLARDALENAKTRARNRLDELAVREQALVDERHRVERELSEMQRRREAELREAEQSYAAALAAWRKD